MSTDPIAPIGDGVPQYATPDRVQQIATRQRVETEDKQVAVGHTAPNVTTSPTYSPALYAQVAIHAQAGVIAAMVVPLAGEVGSSAKGGNPDDIHAVEAAQGSAVDRYA